jgi:Ca2+/H+ antiporter, TMEM165/GDT1 family
MKLMKIFTVGAAGISLFLLVVVGGFGQVVLHLWNWLMPELFGLHPITFWQAVGLMGLCWILFRGGFIGAPFGMHRRRMRERWEKMSPEDRERFRARMRCGFPGAHHSEPQA